MAKPNITSEDLLLNVIINGDEAQKELGKLSSKLSDAVRESKNLIKEQKKLEKEGKENSDRYKEITAELEKHNSTIRKTEQDIQKQIKAMKLEDLTLQQLRKEYNRLRTLRNQSVPNSQQYKVYEQQLVQVKNRMDELNGVTRKTGGIINNLTKSLSSFSLLTGTVLFSTAIASGRRAIETYSEYDDKLADVRKTTNMLTEDLHGLDKALQQIETRTSDEDMLDIAWVGGKMGISDPDDLRGFVESANQIVVALNKDLGGNAEDAIRSIAKLVDVFGLKDEFGIEQGLLKVGSAINELGMASTANEQYLVDFAYRMGGIAPLARVSIDEVLALGSTLDQLGQSSEVSSTALNRLFLQLAKEAETYAQYAGMEVDKFRKLIEEDFMQGLISVLDGIKGNSEGINALAKSLGDLGLDGQRVISVVGALANNTDILRNEMELSNEALNEGISVTNEYGIKNSTVAAELEKVRKEVGRIWRELGEKLWPAITSGNKLMITFLKVLTSIIKFIFENRKVISLLTVAIITYNGALLISNLRTREGIGLLFQKIAGERLAGQVSLLLAAAQMRLTGNILGANLAMAAFNKTIRLNPIGLLVSALAVLGGALFIYRDHLFKTIDAQKMMNEELRVAKERSEELKNTTQQLTSVINDGNSTRYDQSKAFFELQKLYPNLLKNMSLEEFQTKNSSEALSELNKAREEQEKLLVRTNYSNAVKSVEELKNKINELSESLGGPNDRGVFNAIKRLSNQLIYAEERVKQYGKQIEEINKIEFNAKPLAEKLEYYREIESGLKEQIDKLKEQRVIMQDINRGWSSFNDWVNNISLNGLITQLGTVESKILSLSKQSDEASEDNTVGGRRAKLESELKNLTSLYETLSADDIKSRQKNLAERKKIQAELDSLDGRSPKGNKKSSNDAKTKAAAIEREKEFWEDMRETQQEGYEKELYQLDQRWEKTKEILGKNHKDIAQLEQIYTAERAKIQKDIDDKAKAKEIKASREQRDKLAKEWKETYDTAKLEAELYYQERLQQIEQSDASEEQKRSERENLTKEHTQRLHELEQERLTTRLLMLQALQEVGDLEIDEEKRIADEILKIRTKLISDELALLQDANNKKLKDEEDLLRATYEIKEETAKAFEAGFALIGNLVQENAQMANALLVLEKAAAAAAVIINLQKELSIYALRGATNPVSAALNTALATKAKIRAGISLATIAGTTISGISSNNKRAEKNENRMYGRESGGFFDVTREQDGRRFRSRFRPDQRGYVDQPTVLVGENGTEWVASAQAMSNPDVSRIISILDTAQRQGQISTIGLSDILRQSGLVGSRVEGRQSGGRFAEDAAQSQAAFAAMESVLARNTESIDRLYRILEGGITAEVTLTGRKGLNAKQAELERIQKSAKL